MPNKKILKKAIEKVKKNGLDVEIGGAGGIKVFEGSDYTDKILRPLELIFSHQFAKAFWGDEMAGKGWEKWKWHLREMVLEEEPIKYLEQFLN